MRDVVKESTGHEFQLYARTLSPEWGTVSWTSWWEDLATLESTFTKLVADKTYNEAAASGREFVVGGLDDSLVQSITDLPEAPGAARYVGSIQAVAAQGNYVRAFGAGVQIAEKAGAITGAPTMFVQRLTGPYGAVGWFSAFDDLAHFESANTKLGADPEFAQFLDTTQGCFVEGSGHSVLWMKID